MASGPPMLTPMVEPSGVAFATASVPRLPLAPGLFSTTNVVAGYLVCRPTAPRPATTAGVDPAPNGTTIRTVFPGQSCAGAGVPAANKTKSAVTAYFRSRYRYIESTELRPIWDRLALSAAILYCGDNLTRV